MKKLYLSKKIISFVKGTSCKKIKGRYLEQCVKRGNPNKIVVLAIKIDRYKINK